MNAQLPVRRLVDDFHFHLARTELANPTDNGQAPVESPPQSPAPSDEGERPSDAVRACAFAGTARGHGIAISYSFDPGGSGAVIFKWRILLDTRCEPTLVVLRNGKKCRQESGRMAGEFPDVLARNERIQFCFGLVVGRRELERPAICELVVPPFKASESSVSTEARRQQRDAWKRQQYEIAERLVTNEEELKASKAVIDKNALQKFGEPAVIIDSFVQATANVFGQPSTDATPLFERWLTNVLYLLYHQNKTLADIAYFLTPDGDVVIEAIDDLMVRRDWASAKRYRKDHERDTQSLINRVRRFVLNPTMRAMFGQSDVSLDLDRVVGEGQIVLVSLGRDRGQISQENSDLLATLLVSDFWMAAQERGIADSNRPYYLVMDEFQRFVTPAMAKSLAESRKFGVGLTLANQFPKQVFNAGPHGPQIYDEIRENARTKISFRLRSPENAELVANELFLGTFDPYRVKHQHYSTKVLGHRVELLPSYGTSTTATTGGGTSRSSMQGLSHAIGSQWSHTETDAAALTHSSVATVGSSTTDGTERSDSVGRTQSAVESGSTSIAASRSHGAIANTSTNENMGISGRDILPKDADVKGAAGFKDRVEVSETDQTWNRGASTGAGITDTTGNTETKMAGWNKAASSNTGTSLGKSHAKSLTASQSDGIAITATASVADTVGGTKSITVSEAETLGENKNWSDAKSQSVNLVPVVFPVLGKEADAPVFLSIPDQLTLAKQRIFRLQNREAFVLTTDMNIPVFFRSPEVTRPDLSPVVVDMVVIWYQRESGLSLPLEDAMKRVRDRDREWESGGALAEADLDFALPDTAITVVTAKRVRRK